MLTSRPTHGGGAPFGIDLDAGVAKITVRRPAGTTEPTEPTEPAAEPADDVAGPETDPVNEHDEPGPPVPESPRS